MIAIDDCCHQGICNYDIVGVVVGFASETQPQVGENLKNCYS